MKTPISYFLAASSIAFCPLAALAEVEVIQTAAAVTDPWPQEFKGGKLAASVAVTAEGDVANNLVDPDSGIMQTFKGNGGKLKAVSIHFNRALNGPDSSKFKISLLDYGTEVVTPERFNAVTQPVFTEEFRWLEPESKNVRASFVFSGASNVELKADHYYGIVLEFPGAPGRQMAPRTKTNPYADGRLTVGTPGKFDPKFFDRDNIFAIYTE